MTVWLSPWVFQSPVLTIFDPASLFFFCNHVTISIERISRLKIERGGFGYRRNICFFSNTEGRRLRAFVLLYCVNSFSMIVGFYRSSYLSYPSIFKRSSLVAHQIQNNIEFKIVLLALKCLYGPNIWLILLLSLPNQDIILGPGMQLCRCRLFPFRKQAMPFWTVDAMIGNQACHN